jgi:hypothetical protein
MKSPVIAAHVYPGWHTCPERDKKFKKGWKEWDLVLSARAHFDGHRQPRLPCFAPYDDSRPETADMQTGLAKSYGIDVFVYGFFWSRGKRVFERALDDGFLKSHMGGSFPFAIMWANRMPRGVLPVKDRNKPVIAPSRLVYTDPDDFLKLIKFAATNYFNLSNYFSVNGRSLFAVYDSAFFLRQMGTDACAWSRKTAREWLKRNGFNDIHLMALNPAPAFYGEYAKAGFDSVSHYVFLPEWKGEYLQDYKKLSIKRRNDWHGFKERIGLPYFPSVSPGWDATPRGVMHSGFHPRRYPWWPVVTGEHPELFCDFLQSAIRFSMMHNNPPLVFIASWNEWSEGHYLEPDKQHETAWLEVVRNARAHA